MELRLRPPIPILCNISGLCDNPECSTDEFTVKRRVENFNPAFNTRDLPKINCPDCNQPAFILGITPDT